MLPSHTGTQQWQSFEFKMRRRRVERCLLRASVAIEAGVWEDAREALEEVGRLDPGDPESIRLTAALAEAESAPPPPVEAPATHRSWLAVAASLVVLSGAGGWFFANTWIGRRVDITTPRAAVAAPRAPITADAPPAAQHAEPSVRLSEIAIAVPVTGGDTANAAIATDGDTAAVGQPSAGNAMNASEVRPADAPESRPTAPISPEATLPTRAVAERESGAASVSGPGVESVLNLPEPSAAAPAVPTVSAPQPLTVAPSRIELAAASPAPPPSLPPARMSAESDEQLVRAALTRYQAAYNRLDAGAARAVWPAVDQRALARAFEGLVSQDVSLGRCDIRVTGPSAQVTCAGSAKWTPKVGGGVQTAARQWRFTLQNTGAEWVITQANVR